MALTRRQREVLDMVREFIERNGYSPSLEEIGAALGLSSVATVHKHISHLVDKGYVKRGWNQNRSIDLLEAEGGSGAVRVELAGLLAAGRPLEPVASDVTLWVPADMVRARGRTCALKVQGDSLHDHQIRDGDVLVVDRGSQARDGETVIVLLNGSQAWLKRYRRQGTLVALHGPGAESAPLVLSEDRVRIEGVVVGVLRRY